VNVRGSSFPRASESAVAIGPEIAAARTAAGLSLDDVAAATRVRASVLERIERDDFSFCGGDVYARGHLRAIATVVGGDGAEWVDRFDAEHAAAPRTVDLVELEREFAPVPERRRGPNWTLAMGAALALVVTIGAWQALATGGGSAPADVPPPVAAAPSAAPDQPTPSATPSPIDPDAGAVAAADGVSLVVSADDGDSWIGVRDGDGGTLFQGLLAEGTSKRFTDDAEVSIVIGNGAAVGLTVNGVDIGTPGGSGEVVRLAFGPGDPTAG
jgi:cytoskeletal protein RodZ